MAFKTVLTPGIDQPITRDEYRCMELYLVSKHHHPLIMTLTKNTLDTKMTQQHKG